MLITGGARGIASYIAKHLIQTTSARFILIGRKQYTEDWIQKFPNRVSYLAADLTDSKALQSLNLREKDITLIVHAAGVEFAKNILKRTPEEFRQNPGHEGLHREHFIKYKHENSSRDCIVLLHCFLLWPPRTSRLCSRQWTAEWKFW